MGRDVFKKRGYYAKMVYARCIQMENVFKSGNFVNTLRNIKNALT